MPVALFLMSVLFAIDIKALHSFPIKSCSDSNKTAAKHLEWNQVFVGIIQGSSGDSSYPLDPL